MEKERIQPNARELHVIEFLAALDNNLVLGQTELKERLDGIPNGWRDFRLAAKTTERVLDRIYDTLPTKTLKHMEMLYKHGEVVIRPKTVTGKRPDDVQIVLDDDLRLLINTAMTGECAMCVRDAAGQKKCKLRRALENIAPTGVVHRNGLCAYVDVAATNEHGEYI